MQEDKFSVSHLSGNVDHLAPDGSEIRLLPDMNGGGLCHCTLPAGKTSSAVRHKTVEEIWYVLSGEGEIWRKFNDWQEVTPLCHGVALTLPPGTHFQFRTAGHESLCILIVTMPPWPGSDEAVPVTGLW
jgi:mannose-6-phosphate isomerase-like protein (cupin superfamily)